MKNSNNRILTVAVILLLISNIALVVFMMKGKKQHEMKGKGDPAEIMIKELNMTAAQKTDYKLLKEAHFKNIKPVIDSVRAAKIAFFALLKDSSVNDSIVSASAQKIYKRQAIADSMTFAHFKRVRNIFTPEQKPGFDQFIKKMMQRGRKDTAVKRK